MPLQFLPSIHYIQHSILLLSHTQDGVQTSNDYEGRKNVLSPHVKKSIMSIFHA